MLELSLFPLRQRTLDQVRLVGYAITGGYSFDFTLFGAPTTCNNAVLIPTGLGVGTYRTGTAGYVNITPTSGANPFSLDSITIKNYGGFAGIPNDIMIYATTSTGAAVQYPLPLPLPTATNAYTSNAYAIPVNAGLVDLINVTVQSTVNRFDLGSITLSPWPPVAPPPLVSYTIPDEAKGKITNIGADFLMVGTKKLLWDNNTRIIVNSEAGEVHSIGPEVLIGMKVQWKGMRDPATHTVLTLQLEVN